MIIECDPLSSVNNETQGTMKIVSGKITSGHELSMNDRTLTINDFTLPFISNQRSFTVSLKFEHISGSIFSKFSGQTGCWALKSKSICLFPFRKLCRLIRFCFHLRLVWSMHCRAFFRWSSRPRRRSCTTGRSPRCWCSTGCSPTGD